ncbi:MAG: FAD-dependent thymidylate synthase [Desulfurococcales archaeon]|nr:FAD-dependent thymidylate synthase [Desulfurococcales archaeon]
MVSRIRVRLLSYSVDGQRLVAASAKTTLSRKPADPSGLEDSEVGEWIGELIRRGHGSPLEHSVYTFSVEGCSRVFTHQLVRHRIASYTQQSMRYSEGYLREQALAAASLVGIECPRSPRGTGGAAYGCYARALETLLLTSPDKVVDVASIAYVIPPGIERDELEDYARPLLRATLEYYRMLAKGVSRETARYVIPQAVRTNIVFTMNARSLLEALLPLRLCTRAQPETRYIAWMIRDTLVKVHPEIFKYSGPRCVIADNRARMEPCSLEDYLTGRCHFTVERCPELVPREGILNCIRASRPPPNPR